MSGLQGRAIAEHALWQDRVRWERGSLSLWRVAADVESDAMGPGHRAAAGQGGAARGRLAGAPPPLRLQLDFLPPSPPASPAPQWRPWRGWLPTSRRWREEAGVRLAHLPTSYLPTATSELCSLTRSSSSAARSQRNVPTYSTLKMYQQKEILQSL